MSNRLMIGLCNTKNERDCIVLMDIESEVAESINEAMDYELEYNKIFHLTTGQLQAIIDALHIRVQDLLQLDASYTKEYNEYMNILPKAANIEIYKHIEETIAAISSGMGYTKQESGKLEDIINQLVHLKSFYATAVEFETDYYLYYYFG